MENQYLHNIKFCPHCGSKMDGDEKFCGNCGKPIAEIHVCPYCSGVIKGDEKFCPHCDSFLKETGNKAKSEEVQYKHCFACGQKVRVSTKVCPYCGELADVIPEEKVNPTFGKVNILAILGFALSFFVPIAGLILSLLGKKKVDETGRGGALATWGIIISFVGLIILVVYTILYVVFYMSALGLPNPSAPYYPYY